MQQLLISLLTQQISRMQVTLTPRLFCALGKLPVIEAGAEAGGDGLEVFRTLVVAEAIVS